MNVPDDDWQKIVFPETDTSSGPVQNSDMGLHIAQVADPVDDGREPALAKKGHGLLWLWIVLAVLVLLGAVAGGGYWFYQSHALPGVKLWGHSMTGKTQQQIADKIADEADSITIPISYNGTTKKVGLKDLGLTVDSKAVAQEVFNAKRDDSPIGRYMFWNHKDVTSKAFASQKADAHVVGNLFGVESTSAVDAGLKLNDAGDAFDVVPSQEGVGIDVSGVVEEAEKAVESLGKESPSTVKVEYRQTEPAVTDDEAQTAKTIADALIANPVAVKIGDHAVASFDAASIASSMSVSADDGARLPDGQFRKGVLVFDGSKLQQYYDGSIKPNFHADRVDGDVIVNSVGDVLQTNKEGHDGVTVADGGDANVGVDAAKALADGGNSVSIQGTCDPQNPKKTTRTVVVSLSQHTVTAIENGQTLRVMHMSAGQGNNYQTGQCQPSGDLCTPTHCDANAYDNCTPDGDFKIWLKYQSQDMSGNLTLSNGQQENWNVKGVGFVNYFSKTGCAIHRIATQSAYNDSDIQAMGRNTSHGCVGIGWDQAEWFYNWCLMGTTVHVQA